jgi:hypothetical protein
MDVVNFSGIYSFVIIPRIRREFSAADFVIKLRARVGLAAAFFETRRRGPRESPLTNEICGRIGRNSGPPKATATPRSGWMPFGLATHGACRHRGEAAPDLTPLIRPRLRRQLHGDGKRSGETGPLAGHRASRVVCGSWRSGSPSGVLSPWRGWVLRRAGGLMLQNAYSARLDRKARISVPPGSYLPKRGCLTLRNAKSALPL